MLDFRAPLRHTPERVLVAGVTGVGKTRLCRRLADAAGFAYVELDSLHHGPEWSVLPDFERDVEAVISGQRWVSEWQYHAVRDRMLARADTLIWMDYPRRVALPRLLRRTVRRRFSAETLWNGNRERPLHSFFTKPDENIIRWEMKTHALLRGVVPGLEREAPPLQLVRLGGQRQLERWLAGPLAAALAPR